ncbi:MAG: hypothetical protein AB1420_15145 [Bacillota bacterium]
MRKTVTFTCQNMKIFYYNRGQVLPRGYARFFAGFAAAALIFNYGWCGIGSD